MILVVGATGFLGRDICRRLSERGESIRALVRTSSDPAVVAELQARGAQLARGDLRDRESLDAACRGVATVVSTATTTRSRQAGDSIETTDQKGQLDLVDAARAAGVRRYVYVSFSGNINGSDPLTIAKRAVEHHLRDSGMTYTIVRPSYFMEMWLSPLLGFDHPNAKATVYGSGNSRLSWISLGDVAQFVIRALHDPHAENATVELGGPEALSPLEVIRIFEQASGRPFTVQHVPEEALRSQRDSASDSLQIAFASLMLGVAAGDEISMQDTLRTYELQFTPVREYARHAVAP